MLSFEILRDEGIVVITPQTPLQKSDFEMLSQEVDAYLKEHGMLNGLVIHTESFPGWDDFSGFTHHIKFVKAHHRNIRRVAAVTDGRILPIIPDLAKHFVTAEIRHFNYDDLDAAMAWVKQGAPET